MQEHLELLISEPLETAVKQPEPLTHITHPLLFGTGIASIHILDSKHLQIWVQLDADFSIEVLSDLTQLDNYYHEVPYFIEEGGWDDLILDCQHTSEVIAGVRYGCPRANWALSNGLIPQQPFKVEVFVRHFISHSMDGDEGDCETSCEILEKTPIDKQIVIDFWSNWLHEQEAIKAQIRREVPASLKAITQHPELLYVTASWYWSDYYGECSPPNAVRLTLQTTLKPIRKDGSTAYGGISHLVSGASEEGNMEEAWLRLEKTVLTTYPMFKECNLRTKYSGTQNFRPTVPINIENNT